MPRDGSGIYTKPYPNVVSGTTIESAVHNGTVSDIETDLNAPRPIIAGGTGASNVTEARDNLNAEVAGAHVTNYDSHVWEAGSFYSLTGATSPPVDADISGICTIIEKGATDDIFLQARNQATGDIYLRGRTAGVWEEEWTSQNDIYVNVTGDTMTGDLNVDANITITGTVNCAWLEGPEGIDLKKVGSIADYEARFLVQADSILRLYVPAGVIVQGSVLEGLIISGNISHSGGYILNDFGRIISKGNNSPSLNMFNTVDGWAGGFWSQSSAIRFGQMNGSGDPTTAYGDINSTGLRLYGSVQGYKPGGGVWGDSSDARIKNVLGDYAQGLDAIKTLRPVTYTFKGNDTLAGVAPSNKAVPGFDDTKEAAVVPYANSPHVTDREYIGLVAQECEAAFPEMVAQIAGTIDGQPVTDMRVLDTGPLVFALINAVKTLAARVEALEAAQTP